MRSPNEPRCKPWTCGTGSGASICGIAGTSILGGGGGGGTGGLNCEPPGGMNCAEAVVTAISAHSTAPIKIDDLFIDPMS